VAGWLLVLLYKTVRHPGTVVGVLVLLAVTFRSSMRFADPRSLATLRSIMTFKDILLHIATIALCINLVSSFCRQELTIRRRTADLSPLPSSVVASSTGDIEDMMNLDIIDAEAATDEWELDCYSRPVVVEGKKLWEVLISDSAGSFRFRSALPSNQVNSKTLRKVVDDLIESDELTVKPNVIRFFRGAMFNMINIALQELPVSAKPSRCTFALASWLEERHRDVYPTMEGYNANMMTGAGSAPSFLNVRTPVKLPDALRGEQYAFVALPLAEFLPSGGVNSETIGVGRLCPLPQSIEKLPAGDTFVQGVVLLTRRAKAMATWLAGTEVVALQADLRKRVLTMETDIDTQYLMAKLNDQQRAEGAAFEQGKDALEGLHFVSVQEDDDSDPEGFWLLRELPSSI